MDWRARQVEYRLVMVGCCEVGGESGGEAKRVGW